MVSFADVNKLNIYTAEYLNNFRTMTNQFFLALKVPQ